MVKEEQGKIAIAVSVFDLLEGMWRGEGRGVYPTITSFDYGETLSFERQGETSLFYVQRTERFPGGQAQPVTSHWESGFIDILETGELQLANVQSGGRGEVLHGRIEQIDQSLRLIFESHSLSNDTRMVSTARVFELEGDRLRYEMDMATIRVEDLTLHVSATLERVVE